MRLLLGFALFSAGVVLVMRWLGPPSSPAYWVTVWVILTALGILGGTLGEWVQWQLQIRQAEREFLAYEGDIEVEAGPSGIRMAFDGGDGFSEWRTFDRLEHVENGLLLYCGPKVAFYLHEGAGSKDDLALIAGWAAPLVKQRRPVSQSAAS